VRAHLSGDPTWHDHTLRFAENHDEPRASSAFPAPGQAAAAALAVLSVPGVALVHEGEMEGRKVHVPVTLARRPDEPVDGDLRAWFDRLLVALGQGLRSGSWRPCEIVTWPDNRSGDELVASAWEGAAGRWLVVVNVGGARADGRVRPAWSGGWQDGLGDDVVLDDLLRGESYDRGVAEIVNDGLYVSLDPHAVHLLRISGP
jgi:hypothetical protein